MPSCRRSLAHLVGLVLVAGLLIIPASASAEETFGSLDSSTTITDAVAAETAPAISISSDLGDYAPGDVVTLTGTGWAPGEAVHLEIVEDGGENWTHTADVTADGDGVLVYAFGLPDRYVPSYSVTATGATSGTATTSFTDTIGGGVPANGSQAGDRAVASTAGATSISVGRPTNRATGDFLLVAVTVEDLAPTDNICAPAGGGWTLLRRDDSSGSLGSVTQAIFYKFAASNVSDLTTAFTFRDAACPSGGSTVTKAASAAMIRYLRVDPTAPIDDDAGGTGFGSSMTAPSVTTTFANDRVVNLYGSRSDTDITNAVFQNSPNSTATGGEDFPQDTPGATPTGTATAGTDYWVGQTVALKAADQGSIELRKDWVGTAGNATLSIETQEAIGAGVPNAGSDPDDRSVRSSAGTAQVAPSRPNNREPGDFLLAVVTVEDLGSTLICPPSGWTLLRQDISAGTGSVTQAIYYKFASSSTSDLTNAFQFRASCPAGANANKAATAAIIRYTGVDPTTPIDANNVGTGNGTSLTAPSVTTNFANDRVVNLYGSKNDGAISGATFEFSPDAGGTATAAEDFVQAAAGATATGTATGGNDLWVAHTVALKQAPNTIQTTSVTGADGTTGPKLKRSSATIFLDETFDSPTNAADYTADLTCFQDLDNDGEDDGAGEPAVTPGVNDSLTGITTHVICTFTNTEQAGSVSGTKFDDVDRNGDTTGESGLEGWRINAYADDGTGDGEPNDGVLHADEVTPGPAAFADTDVNGDYTIQLKTGTYVICEEQQADWVQTVPDPTDEECAEADAGAPGGHGVTVTAGQDEGDTDFGNYHLATVSGSKFDDFNHDGAWDPNGGNNTTPDSDDENGLSGWTIEAYADDGDGELSPAEAGVAAADSATTGGDGSYELKLPSGDYVVCEQRQTGWAQTAPDPSTKRCGEVTDAAPGGHVVDLDPGESLANQNFGNNRSGRVQGFKFEDKNRDGIRQPDGPDNDENTLDDNEPILEGWLIEAYAPDGNGDATGDPIADDVTDVKGFYELTLPVGNWVICERDQTGWTQSTPDPDQKNCGSIKDEAPGGHAVELDQGEELDRDFGNFRTGGVNGFKFDDRNRDGVRDPDGENDTPGDGDDEPLLEGWTVGAYEPDTNGDATGSPVDTDVVDPKGFYELTEVPVGDWVICETQQAGWKQSAPSNDKCEAIDDDAPGGHAVTVTQGNTVANKDFANYRTATVKVYKEYSDGTTTTPVDITLECTNGFSGTDTAEPATDTPAEFIVGGFAEGDTCDVTEVNSPVGWTPDTDDCQGLTLTAGGTPDCTVTNVPETSIVTAGGCTFDRMPNRSGSQFPLLFTPDNGAYYKLSSTNPGTFFLNVAYDGEEGDDIVIDIPFPFVLQGTNPIKVHSDVVVTENNGKTCYAPAGSLLAQPSGQVTWNYGTGGNNFGDTKQITIDSPEDGLVFVRIHMAYDLKGRTYGCTKYGSTAPNEARDCTSPRSGFDIGDSPTVGYEQYPFSFTGPNDDGGSTIESYNEFKKNPGIGGLVNQLNTLTPFSNAKVDIYQGTKKVATVYTDQDGWYMWTYKYTGKATTFTVKLPNNGNASQSATLKSNGYLNIPFILP